MNDPVPEAEDAQCRAVNLVSAKRRKWDENLRLQTARAWEILWLRDALHEAPSIADWHRGLDLDAPSAAVG